MFLRLCQLKTLVLVPLILNSCTFGREKNHPKGATPTAKWFRINPEHALEDTSGTKSHLFFDAKSRIDWGEGLINFVALTPENSKISYGLDLASGQVFAQHQYCKQNDVWGEYTGSVHRPSYTQGFIPKVLDQLGNPQKIIYFSHHKQLQSQIQYKAKIIAGFVESFCPAMDCKNEKWLSRLVLIGVDPDDVELHQFKISQIKEMINWPKVKAHLENAEGRNFGGSDTYPRWKVSDLISSKDSLNYFRKRAKFFKGTELLNVQKTCHNLYDELWSNVGEVRAEDRPAKNAEEMKQKLEIIKLLETNKEPVGFLARFHHFSEKHYKDILTCSKFVYSGNINHEQEKFWFINYVKGFYLLYQQGYYYHCGSNAWKRNTIKENGEYLYTVADTLKECKTHQIDMAMNYMSNFIRSEKEKTSQFLRFIDYDNQGFGTNEKIYNWVLFPHAKLMCSDNKNDQFIRKLNVFVDDVSWKKRASSTEDYDSKVIY